MQRAGNIVAFGGTTLAVGPMCTGTVRILGSSGISYELAESRAAAVFHWRATINIVGVWK